MNEAIHHGLAVELGDHAPAFVYDVRCEGPDDADRDRYLHLLELAAFSGRMGLADKADDIRLQARSLVKQKWLEHVHNLVTTQGKNDLGTKYFGNASGSSAYTAAWYLLLVGGAGTIAAGDTLASHAGWTEQTPYAGNRPAITFGNWASGSNTASAVAFTITGASTITGAGICSAASGSSGVLYSASNFASPRTMASGDSLTIIPTLSFS